ncbi:MAG: putative Zn-dependent peptidase [Candidatus Paceibacteria bacterium]|jgi:predicted Zn-dependent peptidase
MNKPKIKQLKNGLTIMTIPVESPSLTVMALVNTGSRFESKDNNGISHFLEHMCFKGTEKQSGKDIMRYLDGLGAETNAFTSYELTGYYVKSITKHWKKTLKVVSDIYLKPIFPEEELEKEKGVITGEISMYEDMPMRHIHDVFADLVFGNQQPAGFNILGPRKNIKKMKRSYFVKYHSEHYVASATTIVVAGNIDHKEVITQVEKEFSDIAESKRSKKTPAKIEQIKPRIRIVHKKTDQTHMILGYETKGFHHKDTVTLKVLGSLLGGGMSSRLFEKLREDMGVGYYVSARNTAQSDTGLLQISCGIDSTRVSEVLDAIQYEMHVLKNELVGTQELEKTKEFIIGNTQMGLEATDDLAYYYGQHHLFGLDIKTPNEFARIIKSVSAKDIQRVAKKYFTLNRINCAMIGPHTKKDQTQFMKALKRQA